VSLVCEERLCKLTGTDFYDPQAIVRQRFEELDGPGRNDRLRRSVLNFYNGYKFYSAQGPAVDKIGPILFIPVAHLSLCMSQARQGPSVCRSLSGNDDAVLPCLHCVPW